MKKPSIRMRDTLRMFAPSVIAFILATLVLVGTVIYADHANAHTQASKRTWQPCPSEDSGTGCVWSARDEGVSGRGGGEGRSFWRGKVGKQHFISHRTARYMLR